MTALVCRWYFLIKPNKQINSEGLSSVIAETCFPMKAMLGHVHNLMDKGVDYLFLPTIRDMPAKEHAIKGDRTGSYPCPFVQGIPCVAKAAIESGPGERFWSPIN
ncbi:MAG: acyl-CoA dehydratase activase-related protein [Actinomycetota bacterium]|nr:acyl-CoA dehydratase activase-related protein [Actinomycetota bacterium]